jgi:2-polyprenyl-6-methoxyphenol hydroxylase-like FAD-dependent oxidoreductase
VREGFSVGEVVIDDGVVTGIRGRAKDGGGDVVDRAKVVVGADGLHSFVARAVGAEQYGDRPHQLCGYYSYWSGLPMHGRFETYIRGDRGFAAAPTNDGLTMVVGGWPYAQLDANKGDVDGHWLATFDLAPEFSERIRGATRESKITGTAVPNFFRKPYGPGWALVGDAGHFKDPTPGQGIADALRQSEQLSAAIRRALGGGHGEPDKILREWWRWRDEDAREMYWFAHDMGAAGPTPPLQREAQRREGSTAAIRNTNSPGGSGQDAVRALRPAGLRRGRSRPWRFR